MYIIDCDCWSSFGVALHTWNANIVLLLYPTCHESVTKRHSNNSEICICCVQLCDTLCDRNMDPNLRNIFIGWIRQWHTSITAVVVFTKSTFFKQVGQNLSPKRLNTDWRTEVCHVHSRRLLSARGCETRILYSSREIIVLDLTNFSQNDSSRRPYWLFPTLN